MSSVVSGVSQPVAQSVAIGRGGLAAPPVGYGAAALGNL